jgi:hypothetical protein
LEISEVFLGAPPPRHPFWAHMSIAEFVSVESTEQLGRDLEGERALVGSFFCDHSRTWCLTRNSALSNGEVSNWALNDVGS